MKSEGVDPPQSTDHSNPHQGKQTYPWREWRGFQRPHFACSTRYACPPMAASRFEKSWNQRLRTGTMESAVRIRKNHQRPEENQRCCVDEHFLSLLRRQCCCQSQQSVQC